MSKQIKSNDTFQRIEKKYMLSKRQYMQLRERMEDYMEADAFGLHTICNIYYDTEDYELIRTSIEKPKYKEKLRLRSYGIPGENDKTYLEIKKKYDGVVYKRRIGLSLKEARNYLEHGIKPQKESQILQEIDYFIEHYHPTKKMYIAYDRIAMFGREDDRIRITFDQNIRSREWDLDLEKGDIGERLLDADSILMEVKVGGAYPLWMTEIFNDLKLYPTSFSKYGTIYKEKLTKEGKERICLTA